MMKFGRLTVEFMDLAGKIGVLTIIFFYLGGTTECIINNYSTYFKTYINVVAGNRIKVCFHLSHPLSSVKKKTGLRNTFKNRRFESKDFCEFHFRLKKVLWFQNPGI